MSYEEWEYSRRPYDLDNGSVIEETQPSHSSSLGRPRSLLQPVNNQVKLCFELLHRVAGRQFYYEHILCEKELRKKITLEQLESEFVIIIHLYLLRCKIERAIVHIIIILTKKFEYYLLKMTL